MLRSIPVVAHTGRGATMPNAISARLACRSVLISLRLPGPHCHARIASVAKDDCPLKGSCRLHMARANAWR